MFSFFKKKEKSFAKRSRDFDRRLAEANKKIDNLDFKISEFRRKFMNLQMRGPRAQSINELERMLAEMRMEAEDAQRCLALLQRDHEDCVSLVEGLVDEFEKVAGDMRGE